VLASRGRRRHTPKMLRRKVGKVPGDSAELEHIDTPLRIIAEE
jgi:hypothetical protein